MIQIAGMVSGNTPESNTYPTAAGQTFKRGAPVKLDGSGNVITAAAGTDVLLGVAQHDAQADFTGGQDVAPVSGDWRLDPAGASGTFAIVKYGQKTRTGLTGANGATYICKIVDTGRL